MFGSPPPQIGTRAAILASWLIAFVEYCFQVPANRIGHNAGASSAQLKTFQEVIALGVFCCFSVLYLKEPLRWNYVAGFAGQIVMAGKAGPTILITRFGV